MPLAVKPARQMPAVTIFVSQRKSCVNHQCWSCTCMPAAGHRVREHFCFRLHINEAVCIESDCSVDYAVTFDPVSKTQWMVTLWILRTRAVIKNASPTSCTIHVIVAAACTTASLHS